MAATPRREKVSAVDTAWLRMDRPHNLMVITGVLMFRERLALARLKRLVDERFLVFRRFRQRPVEIAGLSFWENDRGFDLDRHVVHLKLRTPAGRHELQALVSELATTSLDAAHPRWQFQLVDRYEGGSAVILRIHHCYADGIALVRVMLSMTDASAHGPPAMPFEAPKRKAAPDPGDPLAQLMEPLSGVLDTAKRIGATLVEKGVELWTDPSKAVALASQGSALTSEIATLTLMQQDSPTRFKGKPDAAKRVAWADPIPLDEVKTIGRALGASVNDVLLSCVAGAIARYLRDKGDDTDGVVIRALVPVNLRPIEKAYKLGNQFGLVFLELPIGIRDPLARLFAVHAAMTQLKGSYQPVLTLGLMAALGRLPAAVESAAIDLLSTKASAVATNVPGPQQPLYLAGGRIGRLIFWVPQSGDIGLGLSILTYAGQVQFGLIADAARIPDPDSVTARFREEFEKLVLTVLLGPWLQR